MVIDVSETGVLTFVYRDELVEIVREGMAAGRCSIERVSHVEPLQSGQWAADLFGAEAFGKHGPVLGPFALRGEAIAAEVDWIEGHLLGTE